LDDSSVRQTLASCCRKNIPKERSMREGLAGTMVLLAAVAALAALAPQARGSATAQGQPQLQACDPAGLAPAHPLGSREETLAQFEALPPACLKSMFMACTAAASETFMDLGSAATCSIGYEALLKRGFDGNFNALLAWWRAERGSSVASN
jgi:hypothetical protein